MSVKHRASKLRRHRKSCSAKQRHADRTAAMDALMSLVRNRGAISGQMQAYRCLACGCWHVGHRM